MKTMTCLSAMARELVVKGMASAERQPMQSGKRSATQNHQKLFPTTSSRNEDAPLSEETNLSGTQDVSRGIWK